MYPANRRRIKAPAGMARGFKEPTKALTGGKGLKKIKKKGGKKPNYTVPKTPKTSGIGWGP